MTHEEHELFKEAALQLDAANAEIAHLQEKVAAYERLDQARHVLGMMVDRQLRPESAATEEEIHKLAASGEDLEKLAEFIDQLSPHVSPWVQDEGVLSGVTPEAKRDAFVYSGEPDAF